MILRRLLFRCAGILRRRSAERQLDAEVQSHLQLHIDQNMKSGLSPDEARRVALAKFGSVDAAKEAWREQHRLPFVETLLQDLRYAFRSLRGTPGFTVLAVTTLALGIGANTAIFTLVNAVLLERLPFKDPDKLVVLWEISSQRPDKPNVVGPANFIRWTERATTFEQMAGFYEWSANLTGSGDPEQISAQDVTANFFAALGVSPMLGRTFAPDEGTEGKDRVVVLGNGIWTRRFGSDPSIVGRSIQLNGRPFTVIGVMPPGIGLFIKEGSLVGKPAELWTPFAFSDAQRQPRGRYMMAVARLKSGVSRAEAQAQLSGVARALENELPEFDTGWSVRLVNLHDALSGEVRPALIILMGAVGFVLLLACANVANLLLARGTARRREIGIRTAMGAARSRILCQLLTESLLLAVLGGLAGLIAGRAGMNVLILLSPVDVTRLGNLELNQTVLLYTVLVSFLTAAASGLIPAFDTARVDVQQSLKEGAQQTGRSKRSHRLGQAFVAAQVAIAVVLLAGAGIVLRSFSNLLAVDPGFDFHHVLTARVTLPYARYDNSTRTLQFFDRAVESIRAIPGVQSAGEISFLPFAGLGAATDFTIIGQPPFERGREPVVDMRIADNAYFETLHIPLLRGRLFSRQELHERKPVAIINQAMAKEFRGADPIGQQVLFQYGSAEYPAAPVQIIGIVGDVRHVDLTTAPRATAYWAHPQLAMTAMTLTVRSEGDAMTIAPQVARAVQAIDKDIPLSDVRTMEGWVAKSLAQSRFSSVLLASFAALALLLAGIGIYGVMSYSVNQRAGEIAVRLALGAGNRRILQMVVGSAIRVVLFGFGVGIPSALILNRALTALLFNTKVYDFTIFAIVVGVLGGTTLLASYLPARRAVRTTAADALRRQ